MIFKSYSTNIMEWPPAQYIEDIPFSQIAPIPEMKSPVPPDLNDGILELVNSIKKFGLIEPIIVSLLPSGKYLLIAGRRRVLACAILQVSFCKGVVLDGVTDPVIADAIWASENLVRRKAQPAEIGATFAALLAKFGSADEIARQTGLPLDLVRRNLPR